MIRKIKCQYRPRLEKLVPQVLGIPIEIRITTVKVDFQIVAYKKLDEEKMETTEILQENHFDLSRNIQRIVIIEQLVPHEALFRTIMKVISVDRALHKNSIAAILISIAEARKDLQMTTDTRRCLIEFHRRDEDDSETHLFQDDPMIQTAMDRHRISIEQSRQII